MSMRNLHWGALTAGTAIMLALLLVLDRVDGLKKPVLVENRMLAERPAWPADLPDLGRFRSAVDAYANDQFPSRAYLIGGLNYLRFLAGYSGSSKVVVGHQGWLFYDDGSHLSQLRPSTLDAVWARSWVAELASRRAELEKRGAHYFVVAAPVKETIYPDFVPRSFRPDRPAPGDAGVLQAAVTAAAVPGFIDLHAGLDAARGAGVAVYSPFDTHWTGEGAYVGYVALMNAMARQGVPVVPQSRGHFFAPAPGVLPPQDLARMLGIGGLARQHYPRLTSDAAAHVRVRYLGNGTDLTADRVIETGAKGPVLQLTGDSFTVALLPLLYGSFSRIVVSHYQNGFHRPDLIDQFHPDVVLLEVIESGIRHAMTPPPAPNPAK